MVSSAPSAWLVWLERGRALTVTIVIGIFGASMDHFDVWRGVRSMLVREHHDGQCVQSKIMSKFPCTNLLHRISTGTSDLKRVSG